MGRPIATGKPTQEKSKTIYARVLVEMDINLPIPETITFMDERADLILQDVDFGWKRFKCGLCHRFGHHKEDFAGRG